MRQNRLRSSVSFCPRFGTLIILNRSIQVRVYTIREYFYRIRREHQRNGFLAGDLGAGRYALAYPFLELAAENHSVVIPHTFTCVLYNVHKKAMRQNFNPSCSKATIVTVLCKAGHSGVGYNVSLWLLIVQCYWENNLL